MGGFIAAMFYASSCFVCVITHPFDMPLCIAIPSMRWVRFNSWLSWNLCTHVSLDVHIILNCLGQLPTLGTHVAYAIDFVVSSGSVCVLTWENIWLWFGYYHYCFMNHHHFHTVFFISMLILFIEYLSIFFCLLYHKTKQIHWFTGLVLQICSATQNA